MNCYVVLSQLLVFGVQLLNIRHGSSPAFSLLNPSAVVLKGSRTNWKQRVIGFHLDDAACSAAVHQDLSQAIARDLDGRTRAEIAREWPGGFD
jgi:hypothetical protein